MAENTKIQWATHTFNPWRGCTKVAAGCANCYADAQSKRNPGTLGVWGPHGTRVLASAAMWRQPVKWDHEAGRTRDRWPYGGGRNKGEYVRPRVFCASLADVFEDWKGSVRDSQGHPLHDARAWKMPGVWAGMANQFVGKSLIRLDDVRARLFRLIDATPNLDWLLLTKRPENVRRMWSWRDNGDNPNLCENWSKRRDNAWLGTSIACQEDANRNIQELLKCRDLAAKIFLSIEPLIEPVDFRLVPGFNKCGQAGQDIVRNLWVIVGGESGPNARPCDVAWIRSIVGQCHNAGVPCFVKQVGSMCIDNDAASRCHWPPLTEFHQNNERCRVLQKHPKGGDPAEWPEDIRVRKVPS